HLDEPRLCRGSGDAAGGRDADPHLAVRRLQLRHRAQGQASILGAVSPRGLAGPARLALSVQAVRGFDAVEQAGVSVLAVISSAAKQSMLLCRPMDCFAAPPPPRPASPTPKAGCSRMRRRRVWFSRLRRERERRTTV